MEQQTKTQEQILKQGAGSWGFNASEDEAMALVSFGPKKKKTELNPSNKKLAQGITTALANEIYKEEKIEEQRDDEDSTYEESEMLGDW